MRERKKAHHISEYANSCVYGLRQRNGRAQPYAVNIQFPFFPLEFLLILLCCFALFYHSVSMCVRLNERDRRTKCEWVNVFFIYLKILILHRGKFSPILCELMVASHWCLLLTVVIPSAQIQKQRKQLYCSKQNHIAVLDEKQFNVYQQQIEKKKLEKKKNFKRKKTHTEKKPPANVSKN